MMDEERIRFFSKEGFQPRLQGKEMPGVLKEKNKIKKFKGVAEPIDSNVAKSAVVEVQRHPNKEMVNARKEKRVDFNKQRRKSLVETRTARKAARKATKKSGGEVP